MRNWERSLQEMSYFVGSKSRINLMYNTGAPVGSHCQRVHNTNTLGNSRMGRISSDSCTIFILRVSEARMDQHSTRARSPVVMCSLYALEIGKIPFISTFFLPLIKNGKTSGCSVSIHGLFGAKNQRKAFWKMHIGQGKVILLFYLTYCTSSEKVTVAYNNTL